jgi:hypothetical protein
LETQVRSAGLITDPVKLYKVLDAATQSITTDPGLGDVADLYSLAQTLNQIPDGKTNYVTVPNEPYPEDTNRVVWTEPDATNLWNSLINEADSADATASSSASGSSSALGQLESVMELELMAADASTDDTTGATAGASASSTTGTSSPGGADVGTCPVS